MRSECSSPTSHDASLVLADFGEGQRAGAVADFRHDAVPALVDHVAEQLGVLLDGRGLGDDRRLAVRVVHRARARRRMSESGKRILACAAGTLQRSVPSSRVTEIDAI